MNKVFKHILLKSIVALLGVTVLFSCENDIKEVDKLNNTEINTDNHIKDLNMVYTDSGIVKLRLMAPVAVIHNDKEDPYKEFPDGLDVYFYKDRDTVVQSFLRANYGISHEKSSISEVRGNVIVINEKGDTLKTEKMFWDAKKKLIYSDELVQIIQKEQIIIGDDGFEADENFSYYSIRNSSGDLNIEEGK